MAKRPSLLKVLYEISRGDVLVSPYPEAVIDELRRRMLIRTPFGKGYEVTELGYAALKKAGLEGQDNSS